jgi:sulfite reductase alpha subunit-like flavoprotein
MLSSPKRLSSDEHSSLLTSPPVNEIRESFNGRHQDEDSTKKTPFPCPTTYRTALLHYVDITALPRTHVLKELAEYTTDEEEKKLLLQMASSTPEGRDKYHVSHHSWHLDERLDA